ncbi:FadR/GntR family transcriptional regulator [Oryzibacter oryziterrae]|uniref:FadR/GntR family transcriptional regulator n=1 Tax=Oryzibacter oryziterrae TaxID=2766474 RepID=UPI0036F2363B
MGDMKTDLFGAGALRKAPQNNHANVVHQLGLEIVRGTLPPGSLLPGDAELMARFGVSRTVLREALKTLAAKGFLLPKAKIGTRVLERSCWNLFDSDTLAWHFECGISREFLASLSEVRAALEPEAAALAARRRTEQDVSRLYVLIERMSDPQISPEDFAAVDLELHLAIALMSRNPFMHSITSVIEVALATSFRLSSPASGSVRILEVAAEHRRIVAAIDAGDAEAARAAMRLVIEAGARAVAEAVS